LRTLPWPIALSTGDPQRNKNYRKVIFPKEKSDPADSFACARFALLECPEPTPMVSDEIRALREVASRLESQTQQSTRLINQMHNLLSRVFPELPRIVKTLASSWVLTLLSDYPTPRKIAAVSLPSLLQIPWGKPEKLQAIYDAAQQTVASFQGAIAERLVQDMARQVRQSLKAEKRLLKLLITAYRKVADPRARQIETIQGIGAATAAVLVAKIVSIERFENAEPLVGYFGIFPEQDRSGVDASGCPKPSRGKRMSAKGNDLVRKYLWNAAKAASRFNPQVAALYRRLRGRGKRGDVALGHCMRKLLHQVVGVWKTGLPYDPRHGLPATVDPPAPPLIAKPCEAIAGRTQEQSVQKQAVTATNSTIPDTNQLVKISPTEKPAKRPPVDYPFLREQLSIDQILRHFGLRDHMQGHNGQVRGPCPIHAAHSASSRTFSVNLTKNVFQCFDSACQAQGNALDLWRTLRHLSLYEAALDAAVTFNLQTHPGTEKRNP
jgi:transposase